MFCAGCSSSQIQSSEEPMNFSSPISYDLNEITDSPICTPKALWNLTTMLSTALGICGFLTTSTTQSLGIAPEPRINRFTGSPSNSLCKMSRVVTVLAPAAHALIGLVNRLPFHQSGYLPVK